MQNEDTSRRRKFYDQMSEAYDLGSFEEFDQKMNSPESREKLWKFIDGDGKYDIGDYNHFDEAMRPVETSAAVPQQPTVQTPAVATPDQIPTAEASAAAADEYPQPYDASGNVLTHNGEPYSQEVLRRYYSPENKEGNFRDLATIADQVDNERSVSRMQTTGGAGYVPSGSFPIAESQPDQSNKDLRTEEQKAADEELARKNDEFWRNDPTLQQRKLYNARNGIMLDPTIPRDQKSVFQKENRSNFLDVSNPRYYNIIRHNEAVEEGMKAFDKAMKEAEEKGRQSIVNALQENGGLNSLARTMGPNGDIMPDINAIRQGNETSDPQKVMDKIVNDVTKNLMKDEYFVKDGKMLNETGRAVVQDVQQRMIQQLVDARVPKSTAEYVVLNAIKNSDFGKLTRMATNTAYENWLDDVAASQYKAGFWEKVFNGALTFGLNLPEYLGTGVAGGAVSKKILGEFTKRTADALVKKGVQKATAERAAQMLVNNSFGGKATKLAAGSASGATTFGLQPVIGEPVNITYQAGQPGPIEGTVNAPGLKEYLIGTVKEMGKGAAMGGLMIGGAAAQTVEKIAERSVKEGIGRGLAGLAYDSSVMSYFGLQDMKEQDPTFEITPETAAESFAESAASLMLLKAPHMLSLKGKIRDAKEFNRKFNFTPEDREVLNSMGIANPLDMVEKLAYKGAMPETLKKENGETSLPSADDVQSIDAEELQQLTNQYRTFMASDAPETLKAKAQYLIEGKMPSQLSMPVDARVTERNGNVYLDTINENGGVIESRKMKDLVSAEKERMQMNYDIDMNKTAAMERRLNEQEVVNDFAGNLQQEYEQARVKSLSGEDLTADERQAVYLYQNFDRLQSALERQAAGAQLMPEEQALVDAMNGRTNAYVNRDNASKRVAADVERSFGMKEGELQQAIMGHTKAEAEKLAEGTGEQIYEVGNGTYRTEFEDNVVNSYRQALLDRINANEARQNAEDVAGAAEAVGQEGRPQIEAQNITDGGGPPAPPAATAGGEGGTKSDTSGTNGGYSGTESGSSGTESHEIVPPTRNERRDAAYQRGSAVAEDETQLAQIGYDRRKAAVRMFQQLPDSNPVAARVRNGVMQAVQNGDVESAEALLEQSAQLLAPEQREAVDQYLDAIETQTGVEDAAVTRTEAFETQRREQLQVIADPQGNVTPLQLNDGRTVYYKSGDLDNHYGGVMAVDENGEAVQVSVRQITEIGQPQNIGTILDAETENFYQQTLDRYAVLSEGMPLQGQQVDMILSGQPVRAIYNGEDAAGNSIFQLEDGSAITLNPQDAMQAAAEANQAKIQAELQAEADAAVVRQQTEQFEAKIKGYKEGQPDLSAAETDVRTAAEYIKSQLGADAKEAEKARRQQLTDIENTKEQMAQRREEAEQELRRLEQWLRGNEDITDPSELYKITERKMQLRNAIADLAQRQQKWTDIRLELMSPEERTQMEQQRRRDVFNARRGYKPHLESVNVRQNADRLYEDEDGKLVLGLSAPGNVNNYLLKNFEDAIEAEKFMNQQRLDLRNQQRDVVQPEINRLNDLLNQFTAGHTDLTTDEIKDIVTQVADLEARQDALSDQAARLRDITEGIPALYERNRPQQQLTPAEQRGKEIDKASSREDKVRIAQNVYGRYPEAADIIADQEPRDLDEFVAANLGLSSMNWEGFDQGERHIIGVQEALFGKSGGTRGIGKQYSTNAFNQYLAPTGEGKGFAEIVHDIYESQPDIGDSKRWTTEDISDALLDLLRTAQKPSDISHRIIDNRIAEAESVVRQQEEYERELEEQAKMEEMQQWAEAHHLDPEERETFEEYLKMPPTEPELEVINQIIAENEEKQNTGSEGVDSQHPGGAAGADGEDGQSIVQGQGAGGETGGNQEQQVIVSRTEAGNGKPSVPDTDVSGGTSVAEHLQVVKDRVSKQLEKYRTLAPVEVIDINSDDELRRIAGDDDPELVRKYLKDSKLPAVYDTDSKKILIFAENISEDDIEEAFFHENLHRGLQQYYGGGLIEVAEAFWETESPTNPEGTRQRKQEVSDAYADKPEDIKEEYLVNAFSHQMTNGTVENLFPRLSAEHQEVIGNILTNIGYDRAKESAQRKRTGGANPEEDGEEISSAIQDPASGRGGVNESFPARLARAKAETDVNPTEAQKAAGNYKMGHIRFGGYSMSIENPKGSTRSGVDKEGKPWSIDMKDTYGYIGKKYGTDGDHLDFFINDDADLDEFAGRVFIVDQKNEDGTFDEHKVMYGYPTWSRARKAYERNYEPGWWDKHVMQMTGVRKDVFDKWLADSDRKTKPFAEYYRTRMAETVSNPADQLLADVEERERAAILADIKPWWDEKTIAKKTDDELAQLREKARKDIGTANVLLGTTNIEKGSEKEMRLKIHKEQARVNIEAIDRELERRRKERQNLIESMEAGGAMVDHLQNMGIDVSDDIAENRRVRKQAEKDNSEEGRMRKMTSSSGTVYGFAYRGKLYLDPRKIDANLPLHEYGHLWCEAFRRLNPEGWKEVVDTMKQDADTWKFIKDINPDLKTDDDIAEEMISKGSGENGQQRIMEEFERMSQRDPSYKGKWGNIWKNISKAIQDFWKKVGDFLHIKYESPQQVYDQVLKDFASGVNPRKKVEQYLRQRDEEYMTAVRDGDITKVTQIFNDALKENIGNGMTPFVAVDTYRKLQHIARKIKKGDAAAIDKAAELMAPLIPENAVLIPVPSHEGKATDMLQLANAIAAKTGSKVADILSSTSRKSQYETKREGGKAMTSGELGITVNGEIPEGKIPVVIDNVVDSGNTAEACIKALGTGIVASLADSANKSTHAATLKSALPIVEDLDGNVIPLSKRFDLGRRYLGKKPDALDQLFEDIDSRRNAADEIKGKKELQAAIEAYEEERKLTPAENEVRQRATTATIQMMNYTGVPMKKVSQEEADQMMELFTTMNQQAISDYARSMQPDWRKRYAVINVRDPYGVPKFFEVKKYAEEYKVWGNRMGGKFQTLDLDKNLESEELRKAADIQPQIDVWHGSGAVFTKFDHSFMGTGQGSQVFGYGTYLTNNKDIGKDYADMSEKVIGHVTHNGKPVVQRSAWDNVKGRVAGFVAGAKGNIEDAKAHIKTEISYADDELSHFKGKDKKKFANTIERIKGNIRWYNEYLKAIDEGEWGYSETRTPKVLYKVEIPDDTGTNYLPWKEAYDDSLPKSLVEKLGEEKYAQWAEEVNRLGFNSKSSVPYSGRNAYKALSKVLGSDEAASKLLNEIGYSGVRFPAGTIRGNGRGATNYVIFNEDDAKIVESIQFMFDDGAEPKTIFMSNAMKAVEGIRQEKATPEQWLAMIQKNGGLKAGEDKWIGLSDWLKEQKGSVTKQEVMDFIRQNQIQIEEQAYMEYINLDDNPKMNEFRNEFDRLVEKYDNERNAVVRESESFNQEMYDKYGQGWANDISKLSEEDRKRYGDITNRYDFLNDNDIEQLAFADMVENHGEDFSMAFEVNYGNRKLEPQMDMYGDDLSDAAKHFLEFEEQPINSTRLEYTTQGLDNKREIALIVPTIEPYNEGDNIHFGDAGEGRAVAWIRFGDTTVYDPEQTVIRKKAEKDFYDFLDKMADKYETDGSGEHTIDKLAPEERAEAERLNLARLEAIKAEDETAKKVLVIDEIQSKRHQDAREKGYRSDIKAAAEKEKSSIIKRHKELIAKRDELIDSDMKRREEIQHSKEGQACIGEDGYIKIGKVDEYSALFDNDKELNALESQRKPIVREIQEIEQEMRSWNQRYKEGVPDAPFEKNWHELAMKRMLRYAAENGYDKIAWTTGGQQAERYNLSSVINRIDVANWGEDINEGKLDVELGYKGPSSYVPENDVEKAIKEYIEYCMSKGESFALSVAYAHNQINDAPKESEGWTDEAVEKVADAIEEELTGYKDARGVLLDIKNGDLIDMTVTKEGKVIGSSDTSFEGKSLADVVGKDMAQKIIGTEGKGRIAGNNLRIGGEGMKGFYDQILPRFMDKYGKKWGVKTGTINLPDLEKSAQTMWSIDVTPEMKESVMQGQPMFQKGQGGRVYGWTDGTAIYLTPLGMNPNSPMHEYTHIWDGYIQKHDPKLWKEMVKTFKKTAAWQELRENPNYRAIWDDEDRMASEVHSRLTGARSEEEFMRAAADPNNKDADSIIKAVKDVLRRFWERLAQLFGYGRDRLNEFILMPLKDALNGFDPRTGTNTFDPRAMVGWHGSAAKFDRFDHSKVGSGEGQAVSGFGTYVTTSEGTARYYAKVASDKRRKVIQEMGYTLDGKVVHDPALVRAADYLKKADNNIDEAIKACEHTIEVLNRHKDKNPFAALLGSGKSTAEEAMDYLLHEKENPGSIGFQEEIVEQPDKQLYEVDIPDDDGKNYLNLDKKLTKAQKVKFKEAFLNALDKSDDADYWKKNRDIIDYDWKYVDSSEGTGDAARGVMEQFLNQEKVSQIFSDLGYKGSKTKGSDGITYIVFNGDDVKINNRIQFQIDQPTMAGEKKPVRSLMTEGSLFTDADFLPEVKTEKGKKSIADMSDEELLGKVTKKYSEESRKMLDEYDRRHMDEYEQEKDVYTNMLLDGNTSLDDARDMYDNVFKQFSDTGFSAPDRTKLLAQIGALEDYIENLEIQEEERSLEEEEQPEAKQKYEQQKQEIRQTGYDLTQLRLRPLEEGETCHVERRYVENGMFSFTGKEKIESIDDVAYIFKELEDAAVENTFLVLEKDGVPTIIHLAIGGYAQSVAEARPALSAYYELDPEKVYFVHNHPSGNLRASNDDYNVLKTMKRIFGNRLQPGIIIDTKSGKYGLFGDTLPVSPMTQNRMPEKTEGEVPLKVYSFSKQVFDADWNPETAFDAGTALRVAKFVSSHRLGEHKKMSLIVMNQNYNVTGNLFLPWEDFDDAATLQGADLIARYMNQMGGTLVTLYGNYDFATVDQRKISFLNNLLRARGVYLLDVIHIDKSAREMGLVSEPGATGSQAGEAEVVEMERKKPIEDTVVKNPNIKEWLDMADRVKTMTGREALEAYKRINSQMLDENGLNIDEQEAKVKSDYISKHGIDKGLGQAMADNLTAQSEKYGFGMMSLRWDLLDRIDELGLTDYINKDQLPDERMAEIVRMYRRMTPEIERLNNKFNKNLDKLKNGKLDKGFVFDMGMPSVPLLTTGFPNLPIRMQASVLNTKTHDPAHPYDYTEVYDLVKHIQKPLAIFEYGDKDKAQNLMIGISQNVADGKQFLVGISIEPVVKGVKLPYNSVRNVFPKNFHDWIHWIAQGKLLRVDGRKEIQDIIDALRINPVDYIDKDVLNSAAKIVKDFENPTISEENLRKTYAKYVDAAEETAEMLGGEKVVFESEGPEEGTLGWYDPNDNTLHVVLPEHADADEVRRTVFHEKLGHEGLAALLGDQDKVNDFGMFVFHAATDKVYQRILEKADEIDPTWSDHQRYSKAAQEVLADIAENGPRTADEFSLWRKIKHYLIKLLHRFGKPIKGLLNDHDLAYYILKTGEALKRWNQMPEEEKAALIKQQTGHEIMRSRRGKPRKRNNESMAQYLQRLREWECWKIAEEQARENNDPMPDAEQINKKWHGQFNRDVAEWRRANNIPEGEEGIGEFPRRGQNESPQEYAARVADYETNVDAWKSAPKLFDYLERANEEYKQAYKAWKERYGIREAESVDLGLYEGDPERMPHIVDPEDLEADMRAEEDLAEAVGIDMSPEGARRHTKISIIERRKNLESANAEDAIWIHNITNNINMEAYRQGVDPKMLREAMADIIEGTYFEDVIKDEHGNVISIEDISDRLPIKMTTGLKDILDTIKDWYDEFYHIIEDAGLRNEAGYIPEGYVNHVWSKEKSSPEAWKKYVENFQRTKSPNMRERIFETYRMGEDIGLVRKYKDISDILAHYSASNNEAVANRKFLDDLSFIVVEEKNGDGEVVSVLPLLNSNKPNIAVSDRYQMYHVPGVGDVWVLKDIQRSFANIFGTMRTGDIPEWLTKTGQVYDTVSSTAKKIELSFSAFHMGALTEVAMAQMRPDRALRALGQYIIFDCAKAGTIPAYAHPEDFKLAASHLVQLGATQDYSAADVNNVTEKLREIVRQLAKEENLAKKGAGYATTPIAAALDYINKGMDKVLWNYLHDGLKIACFKMFAEQIEKRVKKEGLSAEQREQLLDEAGQYVNDTFGGQYWELLNVSPALIKWLRRGFLSPDWLISTQRHFLANFGFGSLYSESGFLNYLRYNADNIKRVLGSDIPKDENRRFRSKNAKQCYLLGVCGFFYVMMNAINAMFRASDEEKEREKADEMRRENPDYRSGYELAYPDGMKWYDYTMYGNTIGQQTHLFLGRYDDGTEWYARWGKQFREFPELFMGRHGVEFPTPLMERMSGKANPVGRYLLYDLPLTVGMYGYKQPRETQEIAEKYGNTVALLAMTAKKFVPYSVPTQQDKEFKMFDLVMPSQKGFTRWKAVDYFKTYIQGGDMDGVMRTYNAAVMNGIDAEDCLKAAIATVKATQRKELSDGIVDLQTAMERYDAEKNTAEKKRLRRKIFGYLAEQNYRAFTRDEAMEQVSEFLNGTPETDNDVNKYVQLATSADVRDEYRLDMIRRQAKKFADEVKTEENDERRRKLEDTYGDWLEIADIIKDANREIGKLKRQLGKGNDDKALMDDIRKERRDALKEIDKIQAP